MKRYPRRDCLKWLSAAAIALPLAAIAQPKQKTYRIGLLIAETLKGQASRLDALRAGLRDYGYIENRNLILEIRSADSMYEHLPQLAADLARLKPDVIVAFGAKAVVAAQRATSTIPIVVPATGDPIALGVTQSLAHPTKNVTGSSPIGTSVSSKRIELLKEAVPRITRVAALQNPLNSGGRATSEAMRRAASALKLEFEQFEVARQAEIAGAFALMTKKKIDAVAVQQDTLFAANAAEVVRLAIKHRLASTGTKEFAEAGGLIGYGSDDSELYRRGAYFIDRLLKGAKPADLPFEQATRFIFVVNLNTAKAMNIPIPETLLVRADKVIQ